MNNQNLVKGNVSNRITIPVSPEMLVEIQSELKEVHLKNNVQKLMRIKSNRIAITYNQTYSCEKNSVTDKSNASFDDYEFKPNLTFSLECIMNFKSETDGSLQSSGVLVSGFISAYSDALSELHVSKLGSCESEYIEDCPTYNKVVRSYYKEKRSSEKEKLETTIKTLEETINKYKTKLAML